MNCCAQTLRSSEKRLKTSALELFPGFHSARNQSIDLSELVGVSVVNFRGKAFITETRRPDREPQRKPFHEHGHEPTCRTDPYLRRKGIARTRTQVLLVGRHCSLSRTTQILRTRGGQLSLRSRRHTLSRSADVVFGSQLWLR